MLDPFESEPEEHLPVQALTLRILYGVGSIGVILPSVGFYFAIRTEPSPSWINAVYVVAIALGVTALVYAVVLTVQRRPFIGRAINAALSLRESYVLDKEVPWQLLRKVQDYRSTMLSIGAKRQADTISEIIDSVIKSKQSEITA